MADSDALKSIPAVEQLLSCGAFDAQIEELSRPIVTTVIRTVIDKIRRQVLETGKVPAEAAITRQIVFELRILSRRRITRVINGTGVLIHTNLGRAPLGRKLFQRVADQVVGYNTLEFDLATGKRGKRGSHLSFLLAQLTGSQASLAVNNNAAALFLILNTFANRKEVIVSRSELVQIGGGFRIPDIIRRAGAKLVEVGTTNKTSLQDYEQAIGARSTILLKVHRSNFTLSGFVDEVSASEIAGLAAKHGLVSVFDLGSGSYHQTERFGMEAEPNITAALRSECDVVCFSGDKLFGAVQAGVILAGAEHVTKMHKNPIYRVLRMDKLAIAMLEEAVMAYLKKEDTELLPLWDYISQSPDELRKRAEEIRSRLVGCSLPVEITQSTATPGGGSLPGGKLDSIALMITPELKATTFSRRLLDCTPPLVCYVENDRILIDLRTIDPAEDRDVIRILREVAGCSQ